MSQPTGPSGPIINLSFESVLFYLKTGKKISRSGWNGKGMYLQYVPSDSYTIGKEFNPEIALLPWIGMKTADNKFVPWLASQTDLLSEDWGVIEE